MDSFCDVIEVQTLDSLLADEDIIVVDCRFYLEDVGAGKRAYEVEHIPSAQYVHLNNDLSAPLTPESGRHPLPSEESMTRLFSQLGISPGKKVVAYDGANGVAASRLWWMLRYMGHDTVAVLNGGMPAWNAAGMPIASGIEKKDPANFIGQAHPELLVSMNDINPEMMLIDSRMPERFRGEIEPIDPVAGHIPGAINFFYKNNYDENGRFLAPALIREKFAQILGAIPPSEVTFYCGSGVTACNNLLALAYAGMGDGKHYVGSWSEWCRNPSNPIALGG